jgi:putative tryptophan/tyrosine transport system substrate-binding protein
MKDHTKVLCGVGLIVLTIFSLGLVRKQRELLSASEQKTRIAILTPATHPSLSAIEKGFRDTILGQKGHSCSIKTYNASGDRGLMMAQAEEAVALEYDLIVAIAAAPALMAQEAIKAKKKDVPLLFTAVSRPREKGLGVGKGRVSGVEEVVDYRRQIELLFSFRPKAASVLLVYNPAECGGLDQDRASIERICAEKGVRFRAVSVYGVEDVHRKTRGLVCGFDVVLVLKDNTVVSALDVLVQECNRHGVALVVSDLDSVQRGAALGFGVGERFYGEAAGKMALEIIAQGEGFGGQRVLRPKEFSFCINTDVMVKQGLEVDDEGLFFISSGRVVSGEGGL